jgi:hypothetical protein
MNRRSFCTSLFAAVAGARRVFAEPMSGGIDFARQTETIMSLMSQTGGGTQFWADVWFFHDWRIQRHALTGHYRLLDGANRRHLSGNYQSCRDKLDEIRQRDNLPPMKGRAVIILHGLFRSRGTMSAIRDAIAESGEFSVFCMGYPTTRGAVNDHAASLESVVRSLGGISEINFVAHSLGNLVVRHWLKDWQNAGGELPKGQSFGRMVMLAPPNKQPQLATKLVRGSVATFVAGPAAQQMASGWEALEPRLATPHFQFGILAGGKGDARGYNPLIPGDDDAVVTVESTRLPGARDFRLLPVLHSFFMNDKRAQELTIRFLTHGHFEDESTREPIIA